MRSPLRGFKLTAQRLRTQKGWHRNHPSQQSEYSSYVNKYPLSFFPRFSTIGVVPFSGETKTRTAMSQVLTKGPGLVVAFCLLLSTPSAAVLTQCYFIDGSTNVNAGFRCNNVTTGHSSCCQPGAVCYSNGVCQQDNEGIQDYLRVGCVSRLRVKPPILSCLISKRYLT